MSRSPHASRLELGQGTFSLRAIARNNRGQEPNKLRWGHHRLPEGMFHGCMTTRGGHGYPPLLVDCSSGGDEPFPVSLSGKRKCERLGGNGHGERPTCADGVSCHRQLSGSRLERSFVDKREAPCTGHSPHVMQFPRKRLRTRAHRGHGCAIQ